jgi:hypothetical protein
MTDLSHWARLKIEGPYPLRRGAWYVVTEFQPQQVVLDVLWEPVSIPHSEVDIVDERPVKWTAVPRPRDAVKLPESWGNEYGVCPNCGNRASLASAPRDLRCTQCEGYFPVNWEENYLGRVQAMMS